MTRSTGSADPTAEIRRRRTIRYGAAVLELWGLTIEVLQVALLVALVFLAVRARAGGRAEAPDATARAATERGPRMTIDPTTTGLRIRSSSP